MGKSAAKIRRNTARATARGETYVPPEPTKRRSAAANDDDDADKEGGDDGRPRVVVVDDVGEGEESDEIAARAKIYHAATKLERSLATLEANPENLNAKERRSAKRRAEAIAVEESGCADLAELTEWRDRHRRREGGANVQLEDDAAGRKTARGVRRAAVVASASASKFSDEDERRIEAAKRLRAALARLEKDGNLNAKERRSAKRKAEAIASEEIGGGEDAGGLLEWYDMMVPPNKKDAAKKVKKIPYILFVGQLSFSTTSDMLFEHFRAALGSEAITKDSVKIRLLVDPKKKNKSRGMAFVELESPELMYECLKLHLTHLDGRRINVERSAGGGAAAKKSRITSFRESQSNFISETMDSILSSFVKNGEITAEELDEGVVGLCKRHSATVVEAALKEYVQEKRERKIKRETLGEKEDEELRNPSAFLTHMIGRIAEEGIGNSSKGKNRGRGGDDDGGRGRGRGRGRDGGRGGGPGRGGGGRGGRGEGGSGRRVESSSILQRNGVDMSISSRGAGNGGERRDDISSIFPSMQRGRGRGRGYM
ncbi:hypothetical protein ACHAW5_004032 [Stephanodiscus triporus]|uniref:RRM domain-containing protein n=1 Tax=Stephanodiscus triporus TaxID=2934178 RepID=A0ABD3NVP2_9STRA